MYLLSFKYSTTFENFLVICYVVKVMKKKLGLHYSTIGNEIPAFRLLLLKKEYHENCC